MEQNQQEAYKHKRIYRSAEQIEKCLKDQTQSGLSIQAYCKAKGMCALQPPRSLHNKAFGYPDGIKNRELPIEWLTSKTEDSGN
jgi:hypothetical protein